MFINQGSKLPCFVDVLKHEELGTFDSFVRNVELTQNLVHIVQLPRGLAGSFTIRMAANLAANHTKSRRRPLDSNICTMTPSLFECSNDKRSNMNM